MMKNTYFQLLFAFIFIGTSLSAQTPPSNVPLYFEIGTCVKQYEYTYSEFQRFSTEYYDYHITLNDYETVILKIDKVSKEIYPSSQIPQSNKVSCASNLPKVLSSELLDQINTQQQVVYLIKSVSEGYEVFKVLGADYQIYMKDDNYFRYMSADSYFDYDGNKTYDPGQELQKNHDYGKLILFNEEKQNCLDKVTFMKIPLKFTATTNLEFVMGVGLIREYSDDMERKLVNIDATPINQYLTTICDGIPVQDALTTTTQNQTKETTTTTIPQPPKKTDYKTAIANAQKLKKLDNSTNLTTQITTKEKKLIDETVASTITTEYVARGDVETTKEIIDNYTIEYAYRPEKRALSSGIRQMGKTIHTVQQGENLYRIALKYKTTVLKIKALNALEHNRIEIGQDLYVQ